MRLPLLEIVQDVQARGMGRGLRKRRQGEMRHRKRVVWIVGYKNADQEHADIVGRLAWEVYGDSGESRVEDVFHGFLVQDLIRREREHGIDRGHDLGDLLLFQIQHRRDDGDLVQCQPLHPHGSVEMDQGFQAGFLVDRAVVLA